MPYSLTITCDTACELSELVKKLTVTDIAQPRELPGEPAKRRRKGKEEALPAADTATAEPVALSESTETTATMVVKQDDPELPPLLRSKSNGAHPPAATVTYQEVADITHRIHKEKGKEQAVALLKKFITSPNAKINALSLKEEQYMEYVAEGRAIMGEAA